MYVNIVISPQEKGCKIWFQTLITMVTHPPSKCNYFFLTWMSLRFLHVCFFSFLLCLDTDAEILPQNRKKRREPREDVLEERGSYKKKGREVFLTLCSMFRGIRAAEHIPVGLRLGAPAWIWITNGPGDGQPWWNEEEEKKKKKEEEEEECVWTLSCFLTVWKEVIWDWAR